MCAVVCTYVYVRCGVCMVVREMCSVVVRRGGRCIWRCGVCGVRVMCAWHMWRRDVYVWRCSVRMCVEVWRVEARVCEVCCTARCGVWIEVWRCEVWRCGGGERCGVRGGVVCGVWKCELWRCVVEVRGVVCGVWGR